ncbi:hypothetical protein BHE74_00044627 [Ensete ventricosum]|nr:hypothetical protein BHE74_00044627 [Ensete ventricosum]
MKDHQSDRHRDLEPFAGARPSSTETLPPCRSDSGKQLHNESPSTISWPRHDTDPRSRAEVSARPVLVRVRKSANVGGGRNFLRGLMLPRGSSTQASVGLSLGPSRGWRSCTKASLEMGGVTQRGPFDA